MRNKHPYFFEITGTNVHFLCYNRVGDTMEQNKYLTVGALTRYLKMKFDSDEHLRRVYLKGEISNFKAHTTGHFYFSLKDETSKINAIMFASSANKLKFMPKDGMKVLLVGRISVYEATGNYQIYVDDMAEDGIGNLYVAFEQLKEKLSKEGLFDEKYKKPIPRYPNRIGIITAPTGAAIRDILSTIKRRYPICETILFPSLVQGDLAKDDLVKKLNMAQDYHLDVLIVGRGGGSLEDMWPFNEECVARAIFSSNVPVISAVGHEVDFTISDFVSDLRAPTPTGAAEMAVPHVSDLLHQLAQYKVRLKESMLKTVNYQKIYLDSLKTSYVLKNPNAIYEAKKQQLDINLEKLLQQMKIRIDKNKKQLEYFSQSHILKNPLKLLEKSEIKLKHVIEKLEVLNPLSILGRGYSLTYQENKLVKSIQEVKTKSQLSVRMQDGILEVQVLDKKGIEQ